MMTSKRVLIGSGTLVVLVAAALIAGRIGLISDGAGAEVSPTLDPDPRAIAPGAEVVARGTVVAIRNGPMCIAYGGSRFLGRPEPNDPSFSSVLPCRLAAAPLVGIDPTRLPEWTQWSRYGFSAMVLLKGRWDGLAIEVREVLPHEASPARDVLGCDPAAPARGEAGAGEASLKGLASKVFGNPHLFAGYWPLGDARNVMVVGTTGNPAEEWRRLEADFPFAMCVVKVQFSQAQLDAVKAEIASRHPNWIAEVKLEHNRVRVIVPVLDGDTLRKLDSYPAALPWPVAEDAN
jgi:hypothetical protein